eukprot:3983439-Pleurochrysis_carterae.AAC.1
MKEFDLNGNFLRLNVTQVVFSNLRSTLQSDCERSKRNEVCAALELPLRLSMATIGLFNIKLLKQLEAGQETQSIRLVSTEMYTLDHGIDILAYQLSSAETVCMIDEIQCESCQGAARSILLNCDGAAKDPSERVQGLNLTAHDALRDKETSLWMGNG